MIIDSDFGAWFGLLLIGYSLLLLVFGIIDWIVGREDDEK